MTEDRPLAPLHNRVYGEIVYWITFTSCLICFVGPMFSMIWPDKNAMNPYFTYALVFEGMTGSEIWMTLYGDWPWFHSVWWNNFFTGDGFTMFGITLGTTVAVWALIPTMFVFAKNKQPQYVIFSLIVVFMVIFAASGIVRIG